MVIISNLILVLAQTVTLELSSIVVADGAAVVPLPRLAGDEVPPIKDSQTLMDRLFYAAWDIRVDGRVEL